MSDLEEQCHIDKGTYTDGPVLTANVRKLFDRIAELDAQLAKKDAEVARLREENAQLLGFDDAADQARYERKMLGDVLKDNSDD
jgi:cell division protein FtsB